MRTQSQKEKQKFNAYLRNVPPKHKQQNQQKQQRQELPELVTDSEDDEWDALQRKQMDSEDDEQYLSSIEDQLQMTMINGKRFVEIQDSDSEVILNATTNTINAIKNITQMQDELTTDSDMPSLITDDSDVNYDWFSDDFQKRADW